MTQTAVEFLYEQLDCLAKERSQGLIDAETFFNQRKIVYNQSKELFKQQSEFIFECGRNFQMTAEGTFNEVYNETFKTESNGK